MFYRSKEAGKAISKDNAKKVQVIHNATMDLGASCTALDMYESDRSMEAALPFTTSHSDLHNIHMPKALMEHLGVKDSWESRGPYVNRIFPTHVVYEHKGNTHKMAYTLTEGVAGANPVIKFSGEPKKVHVAYVDSKDSTKEAMSLLISAPAKLDENWDIYTEICERKTVIITPEDGETVITEGIIMEVVKESATSPLPKAIPVKLIGPGWGSCAYYSKEMLKRDGPEVFGAGTQMFWNHDTDEEQDQRPEGDLNNLAAVLTEAAHWEESGAKGPGLYAKAKVFSDYATQVAEKGPHIGLSVNAFMKAHEGEIEGKSGLIADKFTRAKSIDFVTKAGAKGAPIVPARESVRGNSSEKENTMTEEEIKAMQEANRKLVAEKQALESENAKLTGAKLKTEAVATISEALTRNDIPFSQKILERLCENPQVKEGKLDQDWVKSVAKEMAEAAGQDYGVQGLGERSQEGARAQTDDAKLDAELKESFGNLFSGMSEKGVEVALKGGR